MELKDVKTGIWFELENREPNEYGYQQWLYRVKGDIFIDVATNNNHTRPEYSVQLLKDSFWFHRNKDEIYYSEYPGTRITANRRAIEVAFEGHIK